MFSLIDPELSLLAKERERFLAVGTTPVVSPYDLVETCFDKYKMYQMLTEFSIPTGKCYVDKESFYGDLHAGKNQLSGFRKAGERKAPASILTRCPSDKEIEVLFDLYDDLMIQEFMDGQEYGADVYIDMLSGKCTSIFVKKEN